MSDSDEDIEKTILEFYHNNASRQQAHSKLSSLQRSPAAWQICWRLLSTDKSQEVQFFGATTLHTKALKFWFEVPENLVQQLCRQFLEKIVEFSKLSPNKLIVNKLCMAYSAIILQTIDESWSESVEGLMKSFQTLPDLPDETRCCLLLEVLTALPDQFSHANFGVKSGRRAAIHLILVESFPLIHNFILPLLDPDIPNSVKEQALRCFGSWVEFGVKIDQVTQLADKAFVCLRDDELFEAAADALISVFTKNEPHKYPATLQKYFPEIIKLSELWQAGMASDNMEVCRDISRLAVNFAEENVSVILTFLTGTSEQQELAMNVIRLITMFTDVKGYFPVDETISDLPFGFWYILQDMVFTTSDKAYEHYVSVFTPIYLNLVQILIRKVQYPEEDVYQSMSADEKEQFRCYRHDISDTVMYANCLLKDKLLVVLRSYLNSVTSALPNVRWQDVEALLYIVCNVTEDGMTFLDEGGDADEDPSIHTVNEHTSGMFGVMLVDLINLLTKLNITTRLFSSLSFKLLISVKINTEFLGNYAEEILNVCHHKLLQGSLIPKDSARLLSCVGHILSSLPFELITTWLNKFLPPNYGISEPCLSISDVKRDDEKQPKCDTQPVLIIMKELLPVIQTILSHWVQDGDVVQCVAELLKRVLKTLMDDFKHILPNVCHLLVQAYEYHQHPALLDLIRQLVIMFPINDLVKNMFHAVAVKTLTVLKHDSRGHTDLLESFMGHSAVVCKKHPYVIFDQSFPLSGMLEAAVVGVAFPEAPTMKSCCMFISEVIIKKQGHPHLDPIISQLAPQLYDIILRSIGGAAPRGNVENVVSVMLAFNFFYTDIATQLMNTLLLQENYPTPSVTIDHKQRFTKDVLKERYNKRRLRDTIVNFTVLCRGYAGTEYAEVTTPSPFF